MYRKLSFLVLLCWLCTIVSQAQDCNLQLQGKVIDEHDAQELAFTNIYIPSLERGTVSNEHGLFKITNLCPGKYTLIVSHIGCVADTVLIELSSSLTQNFFLEHHTEELKQVKIVGKNNTDNNSLSVSKIDVKPLQTIATNNLPGLLQGVSGVSTISTGNNIAKPVIQGMHSNRLVLITDGVKQEGQQWGAEHGPELDVLLLDNVEVIKGSAGVLYGAEAIGGALILKRAPLKTNGEGLNGSVNTGFKSNGIGGSSSLNLEYSPSRIKHFGIRFQGSLKRFGNSKTPNMFLENTGSQEENYSWTAKKLGKKSSTLLQYQQYNATLGIFKGAHIGNLTDLENILEGKYQYPDRGFTYTIGRPRQEVEHETLILKRIQSVGSGSLEFLVARQFDRRSEFDSEAGKSAEARAADKPQLSLNLSTWDYKVKYRNTWKNLNYNTGVFYNNKQNTYEGRYFIPGYILNTGGAFVYAKTKVKENTLEFGARYEGQKMNVYFPNSISNADTARSFNNWIAFIGIKRSLHKNLSLALNTGTSFRPPQVSELYAQGLHNGTASIETGNASISSEKAWNNSLTINYTYNTWLTASVNAYANYFSNYISLQAATKPALTIRGAFLQYFYQEAPALYSGLDIDASVHVKHFTITANYSLIRAFELPSKEHLPFITPDFANLTVERNFKFEKGRLNCALKANWFNKQKRIPNVQYAYNDLGEVTSSNQLVLQAPSAYTLLGAECSWQTFQNKPISVGLGINNLLNVKYRQYTNRLRYFSNDLGRYFYTSISIQF